ncbi:MAG: sterol desaturase family protein, partial [Daejeonella sp.]
MFSLDIKQGATLLLVTLLVILTLAEMFISYRENRNLYGRNDTFQNIYLSSLAFVMNLASKGLTFFILDYFYKFRFMEIKNVVVYWLVLIVLQDFLYWVLHYLGHISRIFWAMHVTHHSSEHFNLSTGFRSTVFEPLYRVFFYIPLALFGFSAIDILYAYLITQLYGNLVHTQLKLKFPNWYSFIFVTPSHHRVHH